MARLRAPTRHHWHTFVDWLKVELPLALKDVAAFGLRWSYFAVALLVVVGAVVNWFVPHGWTVWPIVAAIAFLLYIHEASERNLEGIPPLHVYALFFGILAAWAVVTFLLRQLNPFILLGGIGYAAYHSIRAGIAQREAIRLVEGRRAAGLCVHCGEPSDPRYATCPGCGEEPDPAGMLAQRVAAIVKNRAGAARARTVLQRQKATAGAAQKEAALLAKRQRRGAAPKIDI